MSLFGPADSKIAWRPFSGGMLISFICGPIASVTKRTGAARPMYSSLSLSLASGGLSVLLSMLYL